MLYKQTRTVLASAVFRLVALGGVLVVFSGTRTLSAEDCDRSGADDVEEIAGGLTPDCNGNGVPDECEIAPLHLALLEGDLALPSNPTAAIVGDWSADGLDDLVTLHDEGEGSAVVFFTSVGDGTFTSSSRSVEDRIRAVAGLDWDRDGALDLALASTGAVYVLSGGDSQDLPLEVASPGGAVLVAGQFTSRGEDELLVAAADGWTWLSSSELDASRTTPREGATPAAVRVADFNGDGLSDLVAVARSDSVVNLLAGRGDGTFEGQPPIELGSSGPHAIAVGDLDGDRDADLLVGTRSSVVLLRRGDAAFELPVARSAGGPLTSLLLEDFDGDGDLDLLTATTLSNHIDVWQNPGDGPRIDTGVLGAGWSPRRLLSGDFNGDSRPDVAAIVGNAEVARAAVLTNAPEVPVPELRFRASNVRVTGKPHAITMGDWNADGLLDVATCNGGQGSFSVLFGTADGEVVIHRTYIPRERAALFTLTNGDYDADGDLDLAAGDAWSNQAILRTNAGDGTYFDVSFPDLGATATLLTTADLDGNGRADLLSANGGADSISIVTSAGAGAFDSPRMLRVGSRPLAVVGRDLDGDGDEDLAVASANARELSVHDNEGEGRFVSAGFHPVLGAARHVAASDLDRDGSPDLLVTHDGWVTLFHRDVDGMFAEGVTVDTRQTPYSSLVADLNGDGAPDIVTANTIHPSYGSVSVFLAGEDGGYEKPFRLVVGAEPRFAVAGDVDLDGDVDLVTANRTTENITMLRNDRTHPLPGTGDACQESVSFRRGDANADGRTNVADAITLVRSLFGDGDPLLCRKSGDVDDSGKVNLVDVIDLLGFLLRRGAPPAAPHGVCGLDPTDDELPCAAFPSCP